MSTRVARPGTTSGNGRLVGIAAVVLAAVIAVGFVLALNSGQEPTAGVRPVVDEMVWQDRLDYMADRAATSASSPTVNIEKYRLETAGVIGTTSPTENIEGYKVELAQKADRQAMWEQRFEDLVQKFENQAAGSRVIEDTLIGHK